MSEKLKHICFVVPNYPTTDEPVYTFVKQLISAIADQGIKCTVIAPQSITRRYLNKKKARPVFWRDISSGNNKIDIYQPYFFSFSNFNIFGQNISGLNREKAALRIFKKININPDAIYAHFWHSGVIAGIIGEKYKLPVFVASGESEIWVHKTYSKKKILKGLKNIKGAICVSTKNMNESLELGLISGDKIIVIPNGVNKDIFFKNDQNELKEKLGIQKNDFVVAFTGSFNHRKGVLRLSEAINDIPNIKAIYIGRGEMEPNGKEIVFKGQLPHEKIPDYLNVADAFVLPTLAEGCSNAIVEAMACGLPIISSDKSFNDDILTDENSIRIDVMDINSIKQSILTLKNNKNLLEKMSDSSEVLAKELGLNRRAEKVLEFISSKI